MTPPIAAIAISKKRRHIIHAFRNAGATSLENARSLEEIGLPNSLLLEIQKLKGVIVEASPNQFYLDETQESKVARFRRNLMIAFAVIVLLVALYLSL